MQALRTQIRHLAAFDEVGKAAVPTVLLQGETGTGKGLVARLLLDSGPRARGPFVAVNCAAIPETLLEAELFGFEAGAFSDARRHKPGLLEVASGGTLFLDEIAALALAPQGKLLTALEGQLVTAGRFRADLYHRLAVIVLDLPPLRARGEDILLLAEHFLRRSAASHGVAAAAWLQSYDWPGNVRESSHLMERVTLLSAEAIIDPDMLVRLSLPRAEAAPTPGVGRPLDEAARIRQALQQTGGNVLQAARLLGVSRSTLRYRMVRHGLGTIRGGPAPLPRAARDDAAMAQQAGERGGATGVERAASTPRWEQKLVAVLAIDLSLPLATGLDTSPDGAWTLLRGWQQTSAQRARAFGGVLLRRDLPPLLVAFGLPQRAMQTALAIRQLVAEARTAAGREPVPEVRQAIALGQLLVAAQGGESQAQYRTVGEPLSAAVRLLAQPGPGEVVVCPELGRMVAGWCELQACELPPQAVMPQRMRAFRVAGRRLRRLPLAGIGARRRSPFVGRQRELALLRERLAQVQRGRGQVVGILGEPGMGKSRLLAEFRQRLTGLRLMHLEGHCLSYGSASPYLPVLDLLRDHCGITEGDGAEAMVAKVQAGLQQVGMGPDEWAPSLVHLLGVAAATEREAALPPETLKARTFEALCQLSPHSSRQRPLILAVEDLQWIDQTSEAFLALLVERLGGARILLLTTYRPEYRPPWLGKSSVTQLALPPLAPQDSWRLVRSALQREPISNRLVRQILAKADGNPFFLEEIAHTLVEQGGTAIQLPPAVQGVLAARIDRLPAEAKALLQSLAVLGREGSVSLLATLVDQPEAALQRWFTYLQAAEFLCQQPGVPEPTYRFKHALMRDVAYASLPQQLRQAVHERAARALEGLFCDAKAVEPLQPEGPQADQRSA
jgi:transcriptional regulator with AAA-type ATPase domain